MGISTEKMVHKPLLSTHARWNGMRNFFPAPHILTDVQTAVCSWEPAYVVNVNMTYGKERFPRGDDPKGEKQQCSSVATAALAGASRCHGNHTEVIDIISESS